MKKNTKQDNRVTPLAQLIILIKILNDRKICYEGE